MTRFDQPAFASMKIGSTGSRLGMSMPQRKTFMIGLHKLGANELHHGDCQGSDEQAHEMARMLGLWIVGHPPIAKGLRAFCTCDEERPAAPFLERDMNIVLETEFVIATPDGPRRPRSGTWTTAGYAKNLEVPCVVITPAGVAELFSPAGVSPEETARITRGWLGANAA